MQTCMWPSWWHCHSLSLASVKSRLVLPFWYRLTRVVLEKGPLIGCVCVFVCTSRQPPQLRCQRRGEGMAIIPEVDHRAFSGWWHISRPALRVLWLPISTHLTHLVSPSAFLLSSQSPSSGTDRSRHPEKRVARKNNKQPAVKSSNWQRIIGWELVACIRETLLDPGFAGKEMQVDSTSLARIIVSW